jgi:hypothetical protein
MALELATGYHPGPFPLTFDSFERIGSGSTLVVATLLRAPLNQVNRGDFLPRFSTVSPFRRPAAAYDSHRERARAGCHPPAGSVIPVTRWPAADPRTQICIWVPLHGRTPGRDSDRDRARRGVPPQLRRCPRSVKRIGSDRALAPAHSVRSRASAETSAGDPDGSALLRR